MAMQCRRKSPLPYLLLISALGAAACGGSDETCGPPVGTPTDGLTLTLDGATVTYGNFTSGANNDCTAPGSATSLSVEGRQLTPAPSQPFALTLCLPSPEKVGNAAIGLDTGTLVMIVDVSAEQGGCTFARDSSQAVTGTLTPNGYCGGGLDPAGYALTFDATLAGLKTCGVTPAVPVTMQIAGSVAVSPL